MRAAPCLDLLLHQELALLRGMYLCGSELHLLHLLHLIGPLLHLLLLLLLLLEPEFLCLELRGILIQLCGTWLLLHLHHLWLRGLGVGD